MPLLVSLALLCLGAALVFCAGSESRQKQPMPGLGNARPLARRSLRPRAHDRQRGESDYAYELRMSPDPMCDPARSDFDASGNRL